MKVKKNLNISTSDFMYDLFYGGYIDPSKILEDKKDIEKVDKAIQTILEFEASVAEEYEDLYR